MEVVDVAGLCSHSVGQLKHLVGRLSCGDEGLLCAVLRGAYVGCCTTVSNGGWNGAVERTPCLIWLWRGLRLVMLLILLRGDDVSCALTWQGGGAGSDSIE